MIFLFILFFIICKIDIIFPYISYLIFGYSSRINLQNINSFQDFLNQLNSKKRRELKKIIKKEFQHISIKSTHFKFIYIKTLYSFLKNKYNSYIKITFFMILSILLFLSNKLHYFEYYKNNKFLGWSSYFTNQNIYYDFISSPNNLNISIIGINSLKFSIKHEFHKLDMGPTNLQLKKNKFNSFLFSPFS